MTPATRIPADNFVAHFAADFPADDFVDNVIAALTNSDAAALRRLESAAPAVSAPRSYITYLHKRALFAALLKATARNLRLLRCVGQSQRSAYDSPTWTKGHPSWRP